MALSHLVPSLHCAPHSRSFLSIRKSRVSPYRMCAWRRGSGFSRARARTGKHRRTISFYILLPGPQARFWPRMFKNFQMLTFEMFRTHSEAASRARARTLARRRNMFLGYRFVPGPDARFLPDKHVRDFEMLTFEMLQSRLDAASRARARTGKHWPEIFNCRLVPGPKARFWP